MTVIPRNTPDKIIIDDIVHEINPSDLNERRRGRDSFEEKLSSNAKKFTDAYIKTHCTNCFSKQELHYSKHFPTRIEYICSECKEEHTIVNLEDRLLSDKNYVKSTLVYDNLCRLIRRRETNLIAVNYSRKSGAKGDLTRHKRNSPRRKNIRFVTSILAMGSFLFPTFILLNYAPLIQSSFLQTIAEASLVSLSLILPLILVHISNRMKKNHQAYVFPPKDTYLDDINKRIFINRLESELQ